MGRWLCGSRLQGAVALTIGSVPCKTVYVNLIDCSFSTTNANDVILGRSYVRSILPLVQRPPDIR